MSRVCFYLSYIYFELRCSEGGLRDVQVVNPFIVGVCSYSFSFVWVNRKLSLAPQVRWLNC